MPPTLAGFIAFLAAVGIGPSILPIDNPVIAMAFDVAMGTVNPNLAVVGNPAGAANGINPAAYPSMYALAVYNLAADRVLNYAQDQNDAEPVPGSDPPLPYFQFARKQFNLLGFVGGVISSASDEGTSQSMVTPDAMSLFTMRDLQTLKTPFGRTYMEFAQDAGYPFAMA